MTANHSRANAVTALGDEVDFHLKRHDALKLLADEDRERLLHAMNTFSGVTTYAMAKQVVASEPLYQELCDRCHWTLAMICPECAEGCGCSEGCTGWRHGEYDEGYGEDEGYGPNACPECGAGGGDSPYGECVCGEDDEAA